VLREFRQRRAVVRRYLTLTNDRHLVIKALDLALRRR
jgi:hypothetical protein